MSSMVMPEESMRDLFNAYILPAFTCSILGSETLLSALPCRSPFTYNPCTSKPTVRLLWLTGPKLLLWELCALVIRSCVLYAFSIAREEG